MPVECGPCPPQWDAGQSDAGVNWGRVHLTAEVSDWYQGFRFRDGAVVNFNPLRTDGFDADGGILLGPAARVDFAIGAGRVVVMWAGRDELCLTPNAVESVEAVDAASCTWDFGAQLSLVGCNTRGRGLVLRTRFDGAYRLWIAESGTVPGGHTGTTAFIDLDYLAAPELEASDSDAGEPRCSADMQPCVETVDCCNNGQGCFLGACQY
jgi:hypothetical protein